ncbi:MAG TPA: zinc-binding dehydrogenase [Pseudolabrys sp.]|uniref:quinone oxidoreductase family protein n=1 Tax=Pseudolabrys sp. TaxID=1960880 RepID=UPI002DDCA307|nr:zinc-binding dehydrogenase [Pseudolabrys sp.]HEV2629632.1 zinc-binding dehydrogenase [Pseudolabrys sp.]
MKAAVATENGLEIRDIPQPKPKPFELLVKVKAAGLNRADLAAARGKGGHGAAGATVGLDWAGEVVEAGAETKGGFKPGDRVMCAGAGGYAEYAVCDWGRVVHIPDDMSFEHAATLPVALGTMHDALVTNGRLKAGESVLIQGASSGVGLMALQIAKLLGARLVVGTSTNAERRARLKEFGADLAVDTTEPNWPDLVLKATAGQGVDLIVDQVSGSLMNGNMRAAAIRGRIVNVGRLGGGKAEFDFDLHAQRRITYIGVTHRTRSVDELREETRAMWADLADAVKSKKLSLPVEKTYPLDQAKAAQEHMRANQHFGKILLVP